MITSSEIPAVAGWTFPSQPAFHSRVCLRAASMMMRPYARMREPLNMGVRSFRSRRWRSPAVMITARGPKNGLRRATANGSTASGSTVKMARTSSGSAVMTMRAVGRPQRARVAVAAVLGVEERVGVAEKLEGRPKRRGRARRERRPIVRRLTLVDCLHLARKKRRYIVDGIRAPRFYQTISPSPAAGR